MNPVNAGRLEQMNDGVRLIMTQEGGKQHSATLHAESTEASRRYTDVFYSLRSLWHN